MFSKRSDEIEAWLAATGTPATAAGRQAAVLATRRNKPELEHHRLDDRWKAESIDAGWTPDDAELVVASGGHLAPVDYEQAWRMESVIFDEHGTPERFDRLVDPEEWIGGVVRSLTSDRSTFSRNDLSGAVASTLGPGASTWTIERIVNRCIASPHLISVRTDDQTQMWTSRELADTEQRFIATVTGAGAVPALLIACAAAAIADRPTLGNDQANAISTIASSVTPVSVLVGPAGTGKTFTLDGVRAAFERAGFDVVGAAPSARAAIELEAGAAIPSRTLQSLIRRWDTGHERPGGDTLLVIDEAGMADIRTLEHAVSRQVAAGGRVVLVGDQHQLPEVGAGGGFAHAAAHSPSVTELRINRRQRDGWERDALAHLRNGDVAAAVTAYADHDRVIVTDTNDDMVGTAVDRYLAARGAGHRPVLLAGTNDLVDRLNVAVLDRLVEQGDLDDPSPVAYGDGRFSVGERVVIRANSRQVTNSGRPVDIANGQPGTVTATFHDSVTIRLDTTQDEVVLGDTYLRQGGRITHGYALTAHRAQGGTWDLAISVGADGLYREASYVSMSRGIHQNTLIITDPELRELERDARAETERHDAGLEPRPTDDSIDDLVRRLGRSGAKQLAHSIDAALSDVDRLSHSASLPELRGRQLRALVAEQAATERRGSPGDRLQRRIDNTRHIAEHLHVGSHVSPHDRHNIGVVTHLDDQNGSARVRFTAPDGRQASRTFTWDDLRLVDPTPLARPITAEIEATIDRLAAPLVLTLAEWESDVRRAGYQPGDADRYQRAADVHLQRATAALIAQEPSWLRHLVGQPPQDVAGATAWNDAVRSITRYRLEHHVRGLAPGLGDRPTEPAAAAAWETTSIAIAQARVWMASSDRLEPAWPIVPSRRELHERHDQLDELFEAVPDDCRNLADRLQKGGIDLKDTADILAAAATQQSERQQWIIRNWPHIVEYQEINRTLATGGWGPDPILLKALDGTSLEPAAQAGANWIRAALCAIAGADQTSLAPSQVEWLEAVAQFRSDHTITSTAPLGTADLALDSVSVDLRARAATIAENVAANPVTTPQAMSIDLDW